MGTSWALRALCGIAAVLVAVVVALLLLHWYMTGNVWGASVMREAYLHRRLTRHSWPWFDILLPMLVLTVVSSRALHRHHYTVIIAAISLELGILIALLACEALVVSPTLCYWWPREAGTAVSFLAAEYAKHWAFFAIGGLAMRQGYRKRLSRKEEGQQEAAR